MKTIRVPPRGGFFSFRVQIWPWGTRGRGQVLGIDESKGVIHVRVVQPEPEIQHLPLTVSAWAHSGAAFESEGLSPSSADQPIAEWRELHAADEAGAFSVSLQEAIRLARSTAASGAAYPIYSTFPVKKAEAEKFRTVQVVQEPFTAERVADVG